MSFRDDYLPVFDWGRNLIASFGLRTNTLTRRVITWSGGQVGLGTASNDDLLIEPTPKFKDLGGYRLLVGPITPTFSGGGYSVGQLNPSDQKGQTDDSLKYIVTGPNAGEYILVDLDTTKAFSYFLVLSPLDRTRPV